MTEPEIRYLGDLQRIEAKPGDVFVLSFAEHLSQAHVANIQAKWFATFGGEDKAPKLLILPNGARIGVFSPAAEG